MLTNESVTNTMPALMRLIATDHHDHLYEKPRDREQIDIKEFYVKQNMCNLDIVCDIIKINSIVFTMDTDMTIEEFIIASKDTSIHLLSVYQTLFSYDINFLMQFNSVEKYENKFIVKIPEFLNMRIYLIIFNDNEDVQVQIVNGIGTISIFMECIYASPCERKRLANTNIDVVSRLNNIRLDLNLDLVDFSTNVIDSVPTGVVNISRINNATLDFDTEHTIDLEQSNDLRSSPVALPSTEYPHDDMWRDISETPVVTQSSNIATREDDDTTNRVRTDTPAMLAQLLESHAKPTIYTYQRCDTLIYDIDSDNVNLCLEFGNKCTKGYFIECNVDDIINYKHEMNHEISESYNKFQMHVFFKKISDTLLYVPFNFNERYDNTDISSYHGSMNNQRVDCLNMYLTFNNTNNKVIKLHSLTFCDYTMRDNCMVEYIPYVQKWDDNKTGIKHRPITSMKFIALSIYKQLCNNEECHISNDVIEDNDVYSSCKQCKKTFLYDNIEKWLKDNKSCPLCRCQWSRVKKLVNSIEQD